MRSYVVAAICMACFAGGARAQSATDSVALGCYQKAIEAVRTHRPRTTVVRLSSTPLNRRSAAAETRLRSEGMYVEHRDGPWHRFTYDCRYSAHTARAEVSVSFEGLDALRGASAPR